MADASRFFYPLWLHGAEVFQKGLLPLWNPDAGLGTPYLADPEMDCWYPPVRLLYFLLSPLTAFNLSILFHHLFALAGFWVFARGRDFSPAACLLGALLFGFATSAVCYTWDPVMLFAYAWIPWVFWSFDQWRKETTGYHLLLSISLGLQMASGYPLFAYLTILALVLESAVKTKLRDWAKLFISLTPAVLLAVGYNMAWGLPFLEFRNLSNISSRLNMTQSLPLGSLATWLNPFSFGQPLYTQVEVPYWLYSFHMGIPLLALLVWTAFKRKLQGGPAFLFLLWVLLSLGDTTYFGSWMKSYIPFYGWVVRSGYLLPLVFFFGARLGMQSAVQWVSPEGDKESIGMVRIFFALLLFGWAFLAGVPLDLLSTWASLLFLVVSAINVAGGPSTQVRWACLVLAVAFSIMPAARGINFTLEKAYYEQPPSILASMKEPGRIYQSPQVVDSYQTVSGNSIKDVYQRMKQNLIPNVPLGFDREEVSYPNPILLNSYLRWYLLTGSVSPKAVDPLLNYLSVRYRMGENPVALLEYPNPLPKWFSVVRAIPAKGWQAELGENNIQHFHFNQECWVGNPALIGDYSFRKVNETKRTANEVELSALGTGKALLVSSEMDYPGWRFAAGGIERALEDVNYGFRGAVLNPGEEKATLVYRPVSFRLGCFLSLLVMGFWASLFLQWGRSFIHA